MEEIQTTVRNGLVEKNEENKINIQGFSKKKAQAVESLAALGFAWIGKS